MAEDVIPLGWAVGGMVAAGLAAFLRGWFAWHGRVEAAQARATASGLGAWLALCFGLIVSAFAMLYWLG